MRITAESCSGEISTRIALAPLLVVKFPFPPYCPYATHCCQELILFLGAYDMQCLRVTMLYELLSQTWKCPLAHSLVVKFPFPPRRPCGIDTTSWSLTALSHANVAIKLLNRAVEQAALSFSDKKKAA